MLIDSSQGTLRRKVQVNVEQGNLDGSNCRIIEGRTVTLNDFDKWKTTEISFLYLKIVTEDSL